MKPFPIRLTFIVLALMACAGMASAQAERTPADGVERIDPKEVKKMIDKGAPVLVLDVRAYPDTDTITKRIKGAKHISVGELDARLKELPRNQLIVTYCS